MVVVSHKNCFCVDLVCCEGTYLAKRYVRVVVKNPFVNVSVAP
jgi:hypothetical protein